MFAFAASERKKKIIKNEDYYSLYSWVFIIEIFCIYIVVLLKSGCGFWNPAFKAINPLLGKIIPVLCPWRNWGKKPPGAALGLFFCFFFEGRSGWFASLGMGIHLLTSNLLVLLSWDLKNQIFSLKKEISPSASLRMRMISMVLVQLLISFCPFKTQQIFLFLLKWQIEPIWPLLMSNKFPRPTKADFFQPFLFGRSAEIHRSLFPFLFFSSAILLALFTHF